MQKQFVTPLVALFFIACGGGGSSSGTVAQESSTVSESLVSSNTASTTSTATNNDSTSSSNSTETSSTVNTSNFKMAVNNIGATIKEEFNGYILQIITSSILEESKETSQSTIAVYGTINGDATKSLLKINTNYVGQTISVAVFKDESLVAQSETFEVSNTNPINFGEITIN